MEIKVSVNFINYIMNQRLRSADVPYIYDDVIQERDYMNIVVTSFNCTMLIAELISFMDTLPSRTSQCNGAIDRPGVGKSGSQTCPAHPVEF